MFLGHFGVGFGAKAAAPRVSLGTLFLSAQLLDLAWPTMLTLGLERVEILPGATKVTPLAFVHYPWTHSLALVVVWSLAFAATYAAVRRYPRGAAIVGVLVASHWLLDFLVHRPDLPLWPGGTTVGLDAWDSLPATLLLELGLFVGGFALYLRTTRANDRLGAALAWFLALFLAAIYAGNLFGPPPPSVEAIAWAGQAQWLLVLLGYWTDRHRSPRAGGAVSPRALAARPA
ncbi:MAG: hypothetical protein KDB94_05170 [Acidobacteria bacterium]|nr:hypothetical protein [Acidobacteriota bacterium]MCB9378606.1 hypothetical protein [Holophagales bacterium]